MSHALTQKKIGALAHLAMLSEVSATPKPGPVDRMTNGAHDDMDFFTFLASATALRTSFSNNASGEGGAIYVKSGDAIITRPKPVADWRNAAAKTQAAGAKCAAKAAGVRSGIGRSREFALQREAVMQRSAAVPHVQSGGERPRHIRFRAAYRF